YSLLIPSLPISTRFPYTTLFRSLGNRATPTLRTQRGRLCVPSHSRAGPPRVASIHHQQCSRARAADDARAKSGELHGETTRARRDRKSTRLNSSHVKISYAVFCL